MSGILAAPFGIVVILPILLSNIGFSLNPLDRYGGVWGSAGFNGYVTFIGFVLSAAGVHWLLQSIHKVAAICVFSVALTGVAALFVTPLVANSSQSSPPTSPAPSNAQEFRDVVNERAPERGVDPITSGRGAERDRLCLSCGRRWTDSL